MTTQSDNSNLKRYQRIKFSPFYLLSLTPWFVLYFWSDLLFFILYHLIKYRRKEVANNLNRSFPDKSKQELKAIEQNYYRNICDILVESIKALTINERMVSERFVIKNPELLHNYYKEKQDVILYAAHQGNWEWMAFLPLFTQYRVMALFKPLSNPYFNQLMMAIRERFGTKCVESARGYRMIADSVVKKKGSISIIIGDQCPKPSSSAHWTSFLNQETAFLAGGGRIAEKFKQIVLYPDIKKISRGHYQIEFKIISDSPDKKCNAIIEEYSHLLESSIVSTPETWLWSHRRWKLARKH